MGERPRDFWVTVGGERGKEWRRVCGTDHFPVRSPMPERANLPGHPGAAIYLLDLEAVPADLRERIVAHLAAKFGLTAEEAAREAAEQGIPILADDCMVSVYHPQRWL